ncbi:MAG: hypothetical protein AB7F43_08730 [Bacteriovoracia bacterium]
MFYKIPKFVLFLSLVLASNAYAVRIKSFGCRVLLGASCLFASGCPKDSSEQKKDINHFIENQTHVLKDSIEKGQTELTEQQLIQKDDDILIRKIVTDTSLTIENKLYLVGLIQDQNLRAVFLERVIKENCLDLDTKQMVEIIETIENPELKADTWRVFFRIQQQKINPPPKNEGE